MKAYFIKIKTKIVDFFHPKNLSLSGRIKRINSITETLRTVSALAIALFVSLLLLLFTSNEPFEAFKYLVIGPLTNSRYIEQIFTQMIPVCFTGVALAVMLKAGKFNLATEGSFIIGMVVGAMVGILMPLPQFIHPLVAVLIGAMAGCIICVIPALLKRYFEISELVVSLMINFVALRLGNMLLRITILDPGAGSLTSKELLDTVFMGGINLGINIQSGFFIMLIVVIIIGIFISRTKPGYAIKMSGLNEQFANYSAMNPGRHALTAQIIGGAVAGGGGVIYLLSNAQFGTSRLEYLSVFPNKGFDGMLVAIIARNNPFLVPFAALLLSYFKVGAEIMSMKTNVSSEIMSIIQGIIILIIVADALFANLRVRRIKEETKNG